MSTSADQTQRNLKEYEVKNASKHFRVNKFVGNKCI